MLASDSNSTTVTTQFTENGPFIDLQALDSKISSVPINILKSAPGIVAYINSELQKKDKKPIEEQEESNEVLMEVKVPHVTSWILAHVLTFLSNHGDAKEYQPETYKVNRKLDKHIFDLTNEDLPQVLMAADLFQLDELTHVVSEAISERLNAAGDEDREKLLALFTGAGEEVEGEVEEEDSDMESWQEEDEEVESVEGSEVKKDE